MTVKVSPRGQDPSEHVYTHVKEPEAKPIKELINGRTLDQIMPRLPQSEEQVNDLSRGARELVHDLHIWKDVYGETPTRVDVTDLSYEPKAPTGG